MGQIVDSCTVLVVRNLHASTEYYTNVLGFQRDPIDAGPWWAFLRRDRVRILLGECPDEKPASELGDHSYVLYIYVEDVDQLHDEFVEREATIATKPENTPWGMREFAIRTPDGHRIRFGEPIAQS
jgi:uncharacterized glyoxalase superfamily protein PhnB